MHTHIYIYIYTNVIYLKAYASAADPFPEAHARVFGPLCPNGLRVPAPGQAAGINDGAPQATRTLTVKGTPTQCAECHCWKAEESFPEAQRTYRSCAKRVCDDCVEKRRCANCGASLTKGLFTESEWKQATKGTKRGRRGKCMNCMDRNLEQKRCCGCQRSLPQNKYGSRTMWLRGDDRRKCKECSRRGVWTCTQCKQTIS